jgi:hypothetical protein
VFSWEPQLAGLIPTKMGLDPYGPDFADEQGPEVTIWAVHLLRPGAAGGGECRDKILSIDDNLDRIATMCPNQGGELRPSYCLLAKDRGARGHLVPRGWANGSPCSTAQHGVGGVDTTTIRKHCVQGPWGGPSSRLASSLSGAEQNRVAWDDPGQKGGLPKAGSELLPCVAL